MELQIHNSIFSIQVATREESEYYENVTKMQRHRVFKGCLGKEAKGVYWGSGEVEYSTGFEVALNHDEWMICYPNSKAPGTSNVQNVDITEVPGTGKVE